VRSQFFLLGLLGAVAAIASAPFRPDPTQFPLHAPSSSLWGFDNAFPRLRLNRPTHITHPPDGTNRLFVLEQTGFIRVFSNDAAATQAQVFLDLTPSGPITDPNRRVSYDGNEMGLVGLAFSPDYNTTGEFFVSYTADNPRRLAVMRGRASANPDRADASTLESVIDIVKSIQTNDTHHAGMLAFGTDRMLYISSGDGGGAGDIPGNAQNLNVLLGKMLRIDVLNAKPYAIPGDNPFVNRANHRGEIWASGLRNPWRFSIDAPTGRIWLGDVGQDHREELDIIVKGGNYGWNVFEANDEFKNPQHLPRSQFLAPLHSFGHQPERAIVGGYVYRGAEFPELVGRYIYGDFGSGRIWAMKSDGVTVEENLELATLSQPSGFGLDMNQSLLAVSLNEGTVWRLARRQPNGVTVPAQLSQTGIFASLATLQAKPGFQEYSVGAPLWSDGADKRRWLGLPATGNIVPIANLEFPWSYPVGTLLVKHFEITVAPNQKRRLETRVFFNHEEGWRGYTYRWREDHSEADLIDEGQDVTFEVQDPGAPGGRRQQVWHFPSRAECMSCHGTSTGPVLGLTMGQLNHDPGNGNQLHRWNQSNIFTWDIGDVRWYERNVDPYDGNMPLKWRARSYLSANCSQCHNPLGTAPGQMDFRHHIPDDAMRVINVRASEGDHGIPNALRVKPGDPASSLLFHRMRSTDPAVRMPPLATSIKDDRAVLMIRQWIESLP